MSYLNRLKGLFPTYYVTEELGYNWTENDGTALVIKYLGGQSFKGNKLLPIQLLVFTKDVEETKNELTQFVDTYSNNSYWESLDYIKEFYYTPFVVQNINQVHANYVSTLMITGTLLIAENISDIDKVYIDNELIDISGSVNLVYVGNLDNQRVAGQNINKTDIINGMVRISLSTLVKVNSLNTKIRNVRTGAISCNTPFVVKLVYTDNEIEEIYILKLDNASLTSSTDNLPQYTLQFTV